MLLRILYYYLGKEAIPCFVADLLFELVCMWFLFLLCKNEDDPAALCCGAHTRLNEKMYVYSCCSSCNRGVTVLPMPRHLSDKTVCLLGISYCTCKVS